MDAMPLNNTEYIEAQYERWKADPEGVSREWRLFFQGFDLACSTVAGEASVTADARGLELQSALEALIHRHRDVGHLLACLDPLTACPTDHPLLSLSAFPFSETDLDRTFSTPSLPHMGAASLRDIVQMLRETYCRSIGAETMHLQDPSERSWLQERMETTRNRPVLSFEEKRRLLNKLCQANRFEQFLHAKYVGQKRFSLEGAEVMIPMLEALVRHAAASGCREMILGMAHRGRLNVQVNVLGKRYEAVLCEFEDHYDPDSLVGSGDVKYHKGFMGDVAAGENRTLRVLLVPNASHLESVNPVVEGLAKARQERFGEEGRGSVLPVLIHGDAAFSGEGVVAETLNLSQLEGYTTGGTIHLVINNQIGFTTLPEHARSTRYSTDIAKMLMVPVFHVHGENPEAAVHVMKLACDYRVRFGKDVVVDVVCYRRHGHNEGDEPYFTQPLMYARIKERPPVHRIAAERLAKEGVVTQEEARALESDIDRCLELAYDEVRSGACKLPGDRFYEDWEDIPRAYSHEPVETGVSRERLVDLARRLSTTPPGFSIHPKLGRILAQRLGTVEKGEGIDWATGESLALASLLVEGTPVRFSGQDCRRGTFSQRHAVLVDVKTGEEFTPLNALQPDQALLAIHDSMLAENAVLGFEYGYSLASPRSLVLWEAQFGDFANNAQCLIDQYIAAGELKWNRPSGLVLLLPHGLEGQGPEHSSARPERFLQLCAQENMQVCIPTTPAQYFHLLRKQVRQRFRKPLVVMTPKSLLRSPDAVSSLEDLASRSFWEVLEDGEAPPRPRRILFCSGKIFYELLQARRRAEALSCAILRFEQLYPFPVEQIKGVLGAYESATEYCWVQEEPENMGAWQFLRTLLEPLLPGRLHYVGRPAAASPASGYHQLHRVEQEAILRRAVG
ncbi:MAG: 2-oxoglutarate dehydrogenase E1 component [Deltaproteobacteria bacterium]|nr:2-oxoglutarate dehydrogenase E1 component [Deltaproteobacteria bacterium]